MRDLDTGPTELEYGDKCRIIEKFDPKSAVIANKTGIENEWETTGHTNSSD